MTNRKKLLTVTKGNKLYLSKNANYFDTAGRIEKFALADYNNALFSTKDDFAKGIYANVKNKEDIINAYKNSTNSLGISKANNPFSKININLTIGALSPVAGAIGGNLISGGLQSTAGNLVSGIGGTVGGIMSAIPGIGTMAGGIVSGASLLLGGVTNKLFGSKLNQENIAKVEGNINNTTNTATAMGSAASSDELNNLSFVNDFDQSYIGKDGWFSNKAKNKFRDLQAKRAQANNYMLHGFTTGAINLDNNIDDIALAHSAAFGGYLDGIDPTTPIGYSMLTDKLTNDNNKNNNKNMTNIFARTPNMFAMGSPLFAFGGNVETHGGTYSTDLTHIDTGGSHEENPNQGVLMGVDHQGTPNLVEEGEVIYDDYVFSDRLTVPEISKKKDLSYDEKVLKKYSGKTYADAAKKAEKESGVDERPNDEVSRKTFEAILEVLAQSQEKEREMDKLRQMQEAIKQMTPEEFTMMLQQQAEQEAQLQQQQAEEDVMMLQQLMQQPQQVQLQEIPQGMEQMIPQEGIPQELVVSAFGGPLFALGGNLYYNGGDTSNNENNETLNWLKENYPGVYNLKYIAKAIDKYISLKDPSSKANKNFMRNQAFESIVTGEGNFMRGITEKVLNYDKDLKRARAHFDYLTKKLGLPKKIAFGIAFPMIEQMKGYLYLDDRDLVNRSTTARNKAYKELVLGLKSSTKPSKTKIETKFSTGITTPSNILFNNIPWITLTPFMNSSNNVLTITTPEITGDTPKTNIKDEVKVSVLPQVTTNSQTVTTPAITTINTSEIPQQTTTFTPAAYAAALVQTDNLGSEEKEVFNWYNNNHPDKQLSVEEWSKLPQEDIKKYATKYALELKYNKEDTKNFTNSVEVANKVRNYQIELYNSYLSTDDLKDFDYPTLERIARAVDNNYISRSLEGMSPNLQDEAKQQLINDIAESSKTNNVTLGQLNDRLTTPDFHKDWTTVNINDKSNWPQIPTGEYDFNSDVYGGDATVEDSTKGHYKPRDWFVQKDGKKKLIIGDKEYDTIEDYELSNQYLEPRYKLALSANSDDKTLWNDYLREGRRSQKYRNRYTPELLFGEKYADHLGDYEDFKSYIKDLYEKGKDGDLKDSLFFDLKLGLMHGTFKPKTQSVGEVYTVDGTNYHTLQDIKNWADKNGVNNFNVDDYYDDTQTSREDKTLVHTLTPKQGIEFTRLSSLPEGIQLNEDGSFSIIPPEDNSDNNTNNNSNTTSVNDTFPKASEWPYLVAGLGLLGATAYNIFRKPDYSNAEALIELSRQAGNYQPILFRPIGNRLVYNPMDVLAEQNRQNAIARSTDRYITNNAMPTSSQMAGLIANGYNSQLASGLLFENALKYNDKRNLEVAEYNRGTDEFNSEGFLKADMSNQRAALEALRMKLYGSLHGYAMKQAIDDAKASAINSGINGLINLATTYGLQKDANKLLRWQLEHNQYPISQLEGSTKHLDAKGGKIKRRKKGLSF